MMIVRHLIAVLLLPFMVVVAGTLLATELLG